MNFSGQLLETLREELLGGDAVEGSYEGSILIEVVRFEVKFLLEQPDLFKGKLDAHLLEARNEFTLFEVAEVALIH